MALDPSLEKKLTEVEVRFEGLTQALADPALLADRERYTSTTRAYAELEPIVERFIAYRRTDSELVEAWALHESSADDEEMRELAIEEVKRLEGQRDALDEELRLLLLPSDPDDAKNVVLEVRAGAGGDEATLFAGEIWRMYSRYAEERGWRFKTTDCSESQVGGVKEAIAIIEGQGVFSSLKFESGVHRVQRVPTTETQGRIHTSAVTVAILPEADEVEVDLDPKELRIDTFCSSGPGGQSVNTTQSAVRIIHLPTNLVVQCQDEKSWHKNKAQALKVLRSRLYNKMLQEQHDEIAEERRGMVGSGDRSEKIRTYNYPQRRVTDHRISFSVHNLPDVLDGDLTAIIEALVAHDRAERLRSSEEN
jgi:peptide chain release factor 1